MPNKQPTDLHAARDVIMGNQTNYLNADLARLEDLLEQIIALLRKPGTSIEIGGEVHDSILLIGDDNHVQFSRADLEGLNQLQAGANAARREQIYLANYILEETYNRWERLYLPLAGFVHMEPAMMLSDRSDQGLSQAGIRVDDIREAVTKHNKTRLVILGEPGCGKTTTLQRLALDLAKARLQDPLHAHLPIRVDLFKYTGDQQPDDFLHNAWSKTGLAGSYGEAVASRKICFLLDGVNQMPYADRTKRIDRWSHWANHELQQGNWAIFTCRVADYTYGLNLPEVRVNNLVDEQIRRYFEMRFGEQEAARHWTDFEKRLQAGNDRFEKLARNPFMLNLMADSLAEGKSFGDSRALLMQDLADRLLERELQYGRQSETLTADPKGTRDVMLEALSRLAFAMQQRSEGTGLPLSLAEKTSLHERGGASLPLQDVLDLAEDATLLEKTELTENGKSLSGYTFYHHLLQEYFAARRLLALFRAGKKIAPYARVRWRKWQFALEPLPKGQQLPSAPTTGWEETLAFAAALAGRDAEKLVSAIARENLPLAGRCLAEIGALRKNLQPQVGKLRAALLKRQRDEQAHLRARIDAGLALGELGHPELAPQEFDFEGQKVWALLPPMQPVLAGEFIFGSDPADKDAYDSEKTSQRRAHLPAFAMGRYPVTNAEYRFFIEAGGYKDERWWSAEGLQWKAGGPEAHAAAMEDWLSYREWMKGQNLTQLAQRWSWSPSNLRFWQEVTTLDDEAARERAQQILERPFDRPGYWDDPLLSSPARPLVGVNWHEAEAYCRWLSAVTRREFRLPEELEWEKAARGVAGQKYPWGDEFDPRKCNSVEGQVYRTTPVGLYPGGVSPFGLWEASGNIWEWTASWYQAYPGSEAQREEFGQKYRVVRGGAWFDSRLVVRCATRYRIDPDDFYYNLGFRLLSPGL